MAPRPITACAVAERSGVPGVTSSMVPCGVSWLPIQRAALWAAAVCGSAGAAAPAGAANEVMVAALSSVARPTAEAPIRVRRTMCTVLASRTPTRKTPHQRGRTEPQSLCLDGGNSLTLRYPGLWHRLGGAPFTVADQRRILTGFPSRAVQLQHVSCRAYGTTASPLGIRPSLSCRHARTRGSVQRSSRSKKRKAAQPAVLTSRPGRGSLTTWRWEIDRR